MKTKTIAICILLLSMAVISIFARESTAQTSPLDNPKFLAARATSKLPYSQTVVHLDENTSKKRATLLWDFSNVAFSDVRWLEDSEDASNSVANILDAVRGTQRPDSLKSQTSLVGWLEPFAELTHLPKHNVINKWATVPSVGFDWPRNGEDRLSAAAMKRHSELADEYAKIADIVAKTVPALSKATGLPITATTIEDPVETTPNFAAIRIVIAETGPVRNAIKYLRKPFDQDERRFELRLAKAVRFTPEARAQVEGFLLVSEQNEIKGAVCYVSPQIVDTELLAPLVSECLVRALGLPSLSKTNDDALVGQWNALLASISKVQHLDGLDATLTSGLKRTWDNEFSKYLASNPVKISGVTAYDKLMLSILYCNTVKPGMDKNTAIAAIANDENCFNINE
ncbi:hypothetical protein [Sinorhizobium meliloti]|nr:hypothetical protein U8C39_09630 [Sinorhizobium meliloti]WQP31716.1 hypothetical protein U8C45_09595 [Sinorhizobium meliloti]